jgi:hypothetical protein
LDYQYVHQQNPKHGFRRAAARARARTYRPGNDFRVNTQATSLRMH